MDEVKHIPPRETEESSAKGMVNSEKNVLESKVFKDGAIYLFIRADYKKPTWMVRLKVPNRKGYIYRSTRTTDEYQAFKFADDLYNKELVKVLGGEKPAGQKIEKALEGYFERYESERSKLSIHYKLLLLDRCKPFLERRTFDQLDTKLISGLTAELSASSKKGVLSANSIKRIHSDLKHFLNWCVEEGFLDKLPKFPKLSLEASRRPHFNSNDWRKLVRHLREFVKVTNKKVLRDRSMLVNYVLILGNTGIRAGEARGLKWKDVREERGEGDGDIVIVLTVRGKTGQREVVARNADVKKYLKRLLDLRINELTKANGKKTGPDADSLVFCHPDGIEVKSFKKSFNSLLKSAGLERDSFGNKRTVYSLRHTYATFRLHEGVNHYALAQNMGTSVAMLEQHYGHTTNISAAEELTKTKPRSRNRGKAQRTSRKSEFDWLNG